VLASRDESSKQGNQIWSLNEQQGHRQASIAMRSCTKVYLRLPSEWQTVKQG